MTYTPVESGNAYAEELNFKCPYDKKNKSCKDCEIKKRGVWSDDNCSWEYTGVCMEWQKKVWQGACGCAGYHECECGFEEHFCNPFDRTLCPFCEKPVKTIINKPMLWEI